jgi:hypothetical protein
VRSAEELKRALKRELAEIAAKQAIAKCQTFVGKFTTTAVSRRKSCLLRMGIGNNACRCVAE